MSDHEQPERRLTRRSTLLKAGGVLGAALGAGAWRYGDDDASAGGLAAVERGAVSCVLAPELTEGPYYVDDAAMRRNIKGGKTGVPLRLRLRVLDVATCRPIRGAAVDIWHCDALGVYSGVAGNSGSFLRGVQRTDANGWATFDTVYPGWYPGRAVHVHVKVHVGGDVVHTGQFFFPAAVSNAVGAPRAVQPPRPPRHAERDGRDLPQRRQPLDARAHAPRYGLRRVADDGRPPLGAGTGCVGRGAVGRTLLRRTAARTAPPARG